MNGETALTGYQLFDICATGPNSGVYVDFAGVSIPVVNARREDGDILLEVGAIWEWRLEERKDRSDEKPPNPDPGTP